MGRIGRPSVRGPGSRPRQLSTRAQRGCERRRSASTASTQARQQVRTHPVQGLPQLPAVFARLVQGLFQQLLPRSVVLGRLSGAMAHRTVRIQDERPGNLDRCRPVPSVPGGSAGADGVPTMTLDRNRRRRAAAGRRLWPRLARQACSPPPGLPRERQHSIGEPLHETNRAPGRNSCPPPCIRPGASPTRPRPPTTRNRLSETDKKLTRKLSPQLPTTCGRAAATQQPRGGGVPRSHRRGWGGAFPVAWGEQCPGATAPPCMDNARLPDNVPDRSQPAEATGTRPARRRVRAERSEGWRTSATGRSDPSPESEGPVHVGTRLVSPRVVEGVRARDRRTRVTGLAPIPADADGCEDSGMAIDVPEPASEVYWTGLRWVEATLMQLNDSKTRSTRSSALCSTRALLDPAMRRQCNDKDGARWRASFDECDPQDPHRPIAVPTVALHMQMTTGMDLLIVAARNVLRAGERLPADTKQTA